MMLKPVQLRNMRDCANDGMSFNAHTILMLLDHIDALQAQLQLADDCQEPLFDELAEKANRIAELETKWLDEREAYLQERNKCEQLEQDALRYRWLQENSNLAWNSYYTSVEITVPCDLSGFDNLDEVVDSNLKGE